jgi:hypothetical protein
MTAMNLAKWGYWLLPPVVFRILSRMRNKVRKQGALPVNYVRTDLHALRYKRFGYFFEDRVISEFCDYLERDNALNRPIATRDPRNQQYLNELIEKGYCVIRGAVPAERIRDWHDELKPLMDGASRRCDELVSAHGLASMKNIQESYLGHKTNFELVSGVIRLWDAQLKHPQLLGFVQHETLADITGSFFGGNPSGSSLYVEYKSKIDWYEPNTSYHCDSPFRILKAWLLLNDVGPLNAPLVYCEKTQHIEDWRILHDLLEFSKYNKRYKTSYAHFSRMELAHLAEEFPELCGHEQQVTGNAGDIIIADTRGVHGGTTLREGYRLQLGLVYSGLGNFFIGDIPESIKKLSKDSQ